MRIKVGRYTLDISHVDKILFPKPAITKQDIISYYQEVSATMLLYSKKHLLTMLRYPKGIDHEGFYQKNAPDYFPAWIERISVKTVEGKIVHYVVLANAATLVYVVNQGCLIPHIWLSTASKLHYPDRLVIDLDPSGEKFDMASVRRIALTFGDAFEQLGMKPFIMTTGSRGLHIVVPLAQKDTFEQVREFARTLCSHIAGQFPKVVTLDVRKSARRGRIFLDYLRNSFSATSVAPYAVRARAHAPVATPIDWEEVTDKKLVSTRYTIKTVLKRLDKKGDPWTSFGKSRKSLAQARTLLQTLIDR